MKCTKRWLHERLSGSRLGKARYAEPTLLEQLYFAVDDFLATSSSPRPAQPCGPSSHPDAALLRIS